MFEKTKDRFYESLAKSIRKRKEDLKLKRREILPEKTRVSKIVNATRNKHHPYMIGKGEYQYLIYLFLCKDHDSFEKLNIVKASDDELQEKCGYNYDKMLWGHIDWDKMLQDVITELSKFDISEKLGKSFEDTLVDYVPYAVIRYDELDPEYGPIWIPDDERAQKRKKAIERVHLEHGSELFKQTFLEKFSGKTLHEFDKEFPVFISDYLEKRLPNKYSFGLQAYNYHINLSKFAANWQNLPEVKYGDVSDKKSDLETLLKKYIDNGREQMKKLEKYQKAFDKLHIDINYRLY